MAMILKKSGNASGKESSLVLEVSEQQGHGEERPRLYLKVAVWAPVKTALWYQTSGHAEIKPGAWVWVPLRHRQVVGVVLSTQEHAPLDMVCAPVTALLQRAPLPADLVFLLQFVSSYYGVSYGASLRLLGTMPGALQVSLLKPSEPLADAAESGLVAWLARRKTKSAPWTTVQKNWAGDGAGLLQAICLLTGKGIVAVGWRRSVFSPPVAALGRPVALTATQREVLVPLQQALGQGGAFLLHGVTGSGKTNVYLALIAEAVRQGRRALVLVPEILLTPQMLSRFQEALGDCVGVLHSALSDVERRTLYTRLEEGAIQVLVGARSALFAPQPGLGVIVVDEEHDTAFKQQDGVWYHARDMALVRGKQAGAVVVLGSATPSLETWRLVEQGKVQALSLPTRYHEQPLPQMEFVDLRQQLGVVKDGWLSRPLLEAMAETLERKEQCLLFLNRRGYATSLLCTGCGEGVSCRSCAVALTWHKAAHQLICHYCGWHCAIPERCVRCQGVLLPMGVGTEQVVERLLARFPAARVARLDRDAVRGADAESVLQPIRTGTVDVVVGTQMVVKGHDFPGVTLVGVLLADQGLHWPDFRAAERVFQTLTQVAGRAGRALRPGRVLVQTFAPDHPALVYGAQHDARGFAHAELAFRRERFYPPYSRMAAVRLDGAELSDVQRCAYAVAEQVKQWIRHASVRMDVLGPAPAPLSRLKGRLRYQLFVRSETTRALQDVLQRLREYPVDAQVRMHLDVDPISML